MPIRFIRDTDGGPLNRYVLVDQLADGSSIPAVIPINATVTVPLPSGLSSISVDVMPSGGSINVAKSNDLLKHILDGNAGVRFVDWDPGNVSAATSRVFDGGGSALRFTNGAAVCPVRAVVV
jgi:hypothetical protein